MGADLARLPLLKPDAATAEQARSAALFICGQASDRADAERLLEECGLIPYESGANQRYQPEKSAPVHHPVAGQ